MIFFRKRRPKINADFFRAARLAAVLLVVWVPVATATDAPADSSLNRIDAFIEWLRPIVRPGNESLIFLPKITYASEAGVGFGAEIGVPFHWGGLNGTDSDLSLDGKYTVRGYGDLSTVLNLGWLDKKYTFRAKFEFSNLPRKFYGVGPDTPDANEEIYQRQSVRYYLEVFRRVTTNLRMGIRGEVEDNRMLEMEPDGLLRGGVPGAGRSTIGGGGLLATYDSRNRRYSPTRGSFHQFFLLRFGTAAHQHFDFTVFNADIRKYIATAGGQVIALQAFTYITDDEVPFWRLAAVGGRAHSRGYRKGRYLDGVMAAVQAEYRVPLWWRFGIVGFGGVAEAAPTFSSLDFADLRPTVGGGLRIRLDADGPGARFDIAYGGSVEVYFTLGDSF